MATFDPLSGDSDNNASTILEIGTQALESYAFSVAFLLFQGAIEEAWQTVVNQPGNSYLPAGSELRFYVNGEGKGSEIRIKKTNSITVHQNLYDIDNFPFASLAKSIGHFLSESEA